MTFLAPALLAGLLAVGIPIVVHLVQRERKTVHAFPSLMFLRRIPNQSMRRRAIRHWPLLALRVLALVLIALAFARPFLQGRMGVAAAGGGARHVVVLLDRSASMGYGRHWVRAQEAARGIVRSLGASDSGAVALFAGDVEVAARSESGGAALLPAIDRARPGAGGTRIAAALRAAAGLLEPAAGARREIVLISDFQKTGWDSTQDVKLPPGIALSTISVAEKSVDNAGLVGLTLGEEPASTGALARADVRVMNYGPRAVTDREVTLDVDGHRVQAERVSIGPHAAATVRFAPFPVAGRHARMTVRMAPDALPADDAFNAVVTVGGQVPVLIIDSSSAPRDANLYLTRALAVAGAPGFATRIALADRVTPQDLAGASVIVLNDSRLAAAAAGTALVSAVNDGAGLLVLLGAHSAWSDSDPDLLPGTLGPAVDRTGTAAGSLGYVDFSHPAFELFSSPRSGDLTAARVFRYRALSAPARVLARFDDGGVALAERRVGRGGVIAWTSTFDTSWNDLALQPVFVPFVHQLMRHLGHYVEPRAWYSVGETYDLPDASAGRSRRAAAGVVGAYTVVSPSATAVQVASGAVGVPGVSLVETGFYEIRPAAGEPTLVAVNGVAGESDLTPLDPAELKARVAPARDQRAAAGGHEIGIDELERRQSLWWYLLGAGLLVLIVEAVVASRLPRIA